MEKRNRSRQIKTKKLSASKTKATLTRQQVATQLGKSVSTIRRMEGKELHPATNEAGEHLFDPAEVDALAVVNGGRGRPSMSEGEMNAMVFEMLEDGKTLREIVKETKIPARVIRDLHREFTTSLEGGAKQHRSAERMKQQRAEEERQRVEEEQWRKHTERMEKIYQQQLKMT